MRAHHLVSALSSPSCRLGRRASNAPKKWPEQHTAFREKNSLAEEGASWADTHELKGVSLEREKDLVNLVWSHMRQRYPTLTSDQLSRELIVDVSQSICHNPWSMGKIRSLTAASRYYSYAADKVLNPQEQFSLLGFGPVSMEGLSRSQAFELASQAMSMPVITMLAIVVASQFAI